jgi:O-antigen/teichoic acid export membrane protein
VASRIANIRSSLLHAVAWHAGYQAFASLLQFGAMLAMARLVLPHEFGQWAVAVGILQVFTAFSVVVFLSHALQLPEGDEPDWTLHWHAGNLIQFVLFVVCNGVALYLEANGHYEGIAPLLHIASVGLLLNTAAQLRMTMLQRRLDFRRLRMIAALSSLFSTAFILVGALEGLGARAMVLGGNVLVTLPFAADLLLIEGWRPQGAWLAWPKFRRYRESLAFGGNRALAGLLASSRGALNAIALPATLGLGVIGLMNRAESLFTMSAGRALGLASDAVYPILPQIATDEARFVRVARKYVLLICSMALAAFGFFAVYARDVSRVLYGHKWTSADSFLLPGSLLGLAGIVATAGNQVLLARGQMRTVLLLELAPRILLLPAFAGVVFGGWSSVPFLWSIALSTMLCAVASLVAADRELRGSALARSLGGPVIATAGACLGTIVANSALHPSGHGLRLLVGTLVFCSAWLSILRIARPDILVEMLAAVPGSAHLERAIGLRPRESQG